MLRPSSQIFDGANGFAGLRINGAAAINREDSLCLAVVEACVRVVANHHFADHAEGLQVEEDHRTRIVALLKPRPKSWTTAMPCVAARDRPDNRTGVQVEHYHFLIMRNIQTATVAIRG